jgi:type I site-specific restriction endonuclease
MSEADTCREYITPALRDTGWDKPPHFLRQEEYFTDGRMMPWGDGGRAPRGKRKFADYILYYQQDFKLAVIEAKEETHLAIEGMQPAIEYAQILGLHFAYATNGHRIIEHDFTTGREREITRYPTPEELFARWRAAEAIDDEALAKKLLQPYYMLPDKKPRYYQEIAINRAVKAILQGHKRVLLTMATGTGKTLVAFQIAWKLWNAGWRSPPNRFGKPKILYEHLTNYLKSTDRFAKTIVFCADQEHAARMRRALYNLNADLTQRHPDYVVRITSDEGDIGATHLDHFMDPENPMPVIATTSKLLTMGVDIPTCKNIVLARVINAITEFKQTIGRASSARRCTRPPTRTGYRPGLLAPHHEAPRRRPLRPALPPGLPDPRAHPPRARVSLPPAVGGLFGAISA